MLTNFLKPIDNFLNSITMYRLVLYCLIALWITSFVLIFLKLLPFSIFQFTISSSLILLVSWISNKILARTFNAITNLESVYITALILMFIITPSIQLQSMIFIITASIISQASKYILAINKKHLFNPVALGVFIPSLIGIGYASWWVGTKIMLIPVLIIGLLIIRKVQRSFMIAVFFAASLLLIILFSFQSNFSILTTISRTFLESPILFFAFIMLTEPLTTPATKNLRMIYAAIVGILFAPPFHLGALYFTPELSLLLGNIYSFLVSPKRKLALYLKERKQITKDTYDFIFSFDKLLGFRAGQYLEFTLDIKNPDSRGNRRYLTIASSPTENEYRVGVKIPSNPSSFKKRLLGLSIGDKLLAGNLSGDFVLPKDNQELVFIAGGIGITPFRSMLKYLLDKNIKRNITLFYSNKNEDEIVYKEIFDEAYQKLGIKTVYNLTEQEGSQKIQAYKGRLNAQIITKEAPNFKNSKFYLSGPHGMVMAFEEILKGMKVSRSRIRKDFFPGYV